MPNEATFINQILQRLKGLGIFLLAIGCARAWLTLVIASPLPAGSTSIPFDMHGLFDYFYSGLSLAIAIFAQKLAPLSRRTWLYPTSFVLMVIPAALYVAAKSAVLPTAPSAAGAAIMGGLGYALMFLLWSETIARFSLAKIAIFLSGSQAFATLVVYYCQGLSDDRLASIVMLLPLISAGAMYLAAKRPDEPERTRRPAASETPGTPWKLIALVAVYFFAYGLKSSQFGQLAGIHSTLSTAFVMLVLFFAVLLFADRISLDALYKSPPLLMLCGFLLVPDTRLLGGELSGFLISGSMTLMRVLVCLILYDLAKRYEIPAVGLLGYIGATQIFSFWGAKAGEALSLLNTTPETHDHIVTAIVVAAIFIATFIVVSEKDVTARWGVKFDSKLAEGDGGMSSNLLISERCDALSKQYGLSPREDEILRLYAKGKNGPTIARDLFIAEGTLKTHTHHIYSKLGVKSRKELIELLEQPSGTPGDHAENHSATPGA